MVGVNGPDAFSRAILAQRPELARQVHYVNGRAWCDGVNHTTMCETDAEMAAREFAALDAMIREEHPRPGDTRTCPGCGRPQHYTGAELGWCHDALVDTWHCADPRKAGA